MVRISLATRPFYNERAVHLLLGAVAIAAAAVLVSGVMLMAELSHERGALAAAAASDEAAARTAAVEAADVLRQLTDDEPDTVAAAAAAANALIDRRLFSWTVLFNHFEQTLPPDVRLVSVQPEVNGDGASITLEVVGRSVAAIGRFMDALEATGEFGHVVPQDEEAAAEGGYRTRLSARYIPAAPADVPAALESVP